MIKPAQHDFAADQTSGKSLGDFMDYLTSQAKHPGVKLSAISYYNCPAQKEGDFIKVCSDRQHRYKEGREGKRGKRTNDLWKDYVYSTGYGIHMGQEDAEFLILRLARDVFRGVPFAAAIHYNPQTGRTDIHIITGIHTDDIPPQVFASGNYGAGRPSLEITLKRLEEEFTADFNKKRTPDQARLLLPKDVNLARRRAAGKMPFAEQLVEAGWDADPKTLADACQTAGIVVTRHTEKTISLLRPLAKKATKLTTETLCDQARSFLFEHSQTPTLTPS